MISPVCYCPNDERHKRDEIVNIDQVKISIIMCSSAINTLGGGGNVHGPIITKWPCNICYCVILSIKTSLFLELDEAIQLDRRGMPTSREKCMTLPVKLILFQT